MSTATDWPRKSTDGWITLHERYIQIQPWIKLELFKKNQSKVKIFYWPFFFNFHRNTKAFCEKFMWKFLTLQVIWKKICLWFVCVCVSCLADVVDKLPSHPSIGFKTPAPHNRISRKFWQTLKGSCCWQNYTFLLLSRQTIRNEFQRRFFFLPQLFLSLSIHTTSSGF